MPDGFRDAVEAACNAEVTADRRIDVRVLPRDEAFALPDIIRTHVASTCQISRLKVVKIENKGNGFRRLRLRIAD